MTEETRILLTGGQGEIEEKKSRFIATLRPVGTEEEASAFFSEIRKKYYDARHNCPAYVLGARQEITRCADDGEPAGTAGRPMLEVLLGAGLTDTAVMVTRYFGGTLLGTGGLVRAYTAAVREGLKHCEIAVRREGMRLLLALEYGDVDRVQTYLKEHALRLEKSDYQADVVLEVVAPLGDYMSHVRALTDITDGRILAEEAGTCVFLDKADAGT